MKTTALLRLTLPLLITALLGGNSFAAGTVEDIKSGKAVLTLDSSFATGLAFLSANFTKIAPATFQPGKGVVTVPITGGVFDLATTQCDVIAGGGFKLSATGLALSFTDLTITLPADLTKAEVTALFTTAGAYLGRIAIGSFDATTLNISTPVPLPANKKIAIHGVPLNLSSDAAAALNTAVGIPGLFSAGQAVGKIEVSFKVAVKTL